MVTAPAPLAPGSMVPYLLPTSDVPRSCIRHGHFELSKGKLPNERSASPLVIGWLHWGGPDTPLQAGIIVPLWGSMWKVDDVSTRDITQIRLIKEVPRFQKRRHEQVYVPIHSISPPQHSAKWYPVYSAHAPQRSPRRYGQQPEGGTNLFLDTRFEPPVVRVHAAMEMWRIVHHGLPAHLASKQEDTLHRLGLTDKEILALAAGLVTFKMTTWINSVLMIRRRQFSDWASGSHCPDIPVAAVSASGLTPLSKRVVLLVATFDPVPLVLVSKTGGMMCTDINDESRAHTSGFSLCSKT